MTCREEQDEKIWLLQGLFLDAKLALYPGNYDKYRGYMIERLQLELGWDDERASAYADKIIDKVVEMRRTERRSFWQRLTGR